MTRNNHLTVEEITRYLDTSDLSEEYLLWMEEISEHLSSCERCQRNLRKTLIVESICEDGGVAAGLRLLPEEEKVRNDVRFRDWEIQQALEPVAYVTGFPNNYDHLRRFAFSLTNLRRAAAAVRGSDAEDKRNAANLNASHPIMPEIYGDKLIVKVAKELVREQIGITGLGFSVVLCPTGKTPIEQVAVWNEADGYYVAEFDAGELEDRFEIYIHETD